MSATMLPVAAYTPRLHHLESYVPCMLFIDLEYDVQLLKLIARLQWHASGKISLSHRPISISVRIDTSV